MDAIGNEVGNPYPLRAIRVLELGRMFSAPWAGQLLADLGAEVIKVEAAEGDITRRAGGIAVNDAEGRPTTDHATFLSVNRGKKSIVVNLAQPDGQTVLRDLVASCDVVIENFKAGDLKRRGLDYEAVNIINPRCVYLSLSGFGQTGPYSGRPAMDTVVQAMSGYLDLTTGEDGATHPSPVVINDFAAGMYAVIGILAALYHRDVGGGTGQHIDLALMDAGVAMMSFRLQAAILANHRLPKSPGSQFAPAGLYEAADGKFQISIAPQADFERFAAAIEHGELPLDPRFASQPARLANRAALDEALVGVFKARPLQVWLERFAEANIMFSPIYNFEQMMGDPQIVARDLFVTTPHAAGGDLTLIKNPLRMSQSAVGRYVSPPLLGQDTETVLVELLGYDLVQIAALRASGAVGA